IPSCHPFILGVDDQHDAANLRRGQQAASAGGEQKLSAESLPLQPSIHSQAGQAEARHLMPCQPASHHLRRPRVINRGGAQTIEAENGLAVGIVNRQEGFRAAPLVALAGVTAQVFTQRFVAAVEGTTIIFPADWLFVPCRHDYGRFGNFHEAASSFLFGAGGCSSRFRTRKLSRPESCTWSASSITALAACTA